jgi:hypothetical protein
MITFLERLAAFLFYFPWFGYPILLIGTTFLIVICYRWRFYPALIIILLLTGMIFIIAHFPVSKQQKPNFTKTNKDTRIWLPTTLEDQTSKEVWVSLNFNDSSSIKKTITYRLSVISFSENLFIEAERAPQSCVNVPITSCKQYRTSYMMNAQVSNNETVSRTVSIIARGGLWKKNHNLLFKLEMEGQDTISTVKKRRIVSCKTDLSVDSSSRTIKTGDIEKSNKNDSSTGYWTLVDSATVQVIIIPEVSSAFQFWPKFIAFLTAIMALAYQFADKFIKKTVPWPPA